jgi:POT family proton-dependent oligopeptide transporter
MEKPLQATERHPPGLYVLFFTEMWERFGFYTIVAMFTLYLQDKDQGFGWTKAEATTLYSNYLMFVYASPLIGGWIADRGLGFRNSVLLGGLIFMIGYSLLSFHSLPMVYIALACLVIGNGFFKPNVSAMVGSLYREGSHLKDRAYNIFYMGINIGAFAAPVVAEVVKSRFGFNRAFAVAALGMIVSVSILWFFKRYVDGPQPYAPLAEAKEVELAEDVSPAQSQHPAPQRAIDAVPEWQRVGALIVIFLIVIVFWMVFHQNGSTLTYWANDNTDWQVSGIISNAINPFWVVTLTFPLVWFWNWLDSRGLEPSTPAKMALGMVLTSLAFLIMYAAARAGETAAPAGQPYAYRMSPAWLIGTYGVLTLAELCLSPMGLSLVSKVAPVRLRGLMMGGWFVATAIGNKLTQIGVLWDRWLHSDFWLLLSGLALATALVLALLLRPLKRAMPGV